MSFGQGSTAGGINALSSGIPAGDFNTAFGKDTLKVNTFGGSNTAMGALALQANTQGGSNTALGALALQSNTTGGTNIALGSGALRLNTTGSSNTALGNSSLDQNTEGGSNTALGRFALVQNTTGSANTALGQNAGLNLVDGHSNLYLGSPGGGPSESSSIRIGENFVHTQTFIEGISGVSITGGSTVEINASGQLGTVLSSARYKEEIRDLGEVSKRLLDLRPVAFRYKAEVQAGERPLQYGLIAEEVAQVFPELVVHNKDGQVETVRYQILSTLLLNELQALHRQQKEEQTALKAELREKEARLVVLEKERLNGEARLVALEGMVQRLTAPSHQQASFAPSP